MSEKTKQVLLTLVFILFLGVLPIVSCLGMMYEQGRKLRECESKGGAYVEGKCLDIKQIPLH